MRRQGRAIVGGKGNGKLSDFFDDEWARCEGKINMQNEVKLRIYVPLKLIFCALRPTRRSPLDFFSMMWAVMGGWWETCLTSGSVNPRPFLSGQMP